MNSLFDELFHNTANVIKQQMVLFTIDIAFINYLLTESEVIPGNMKLRLERIDRVIARLIRQNRSGQHGSAKMALIPTQIMTQASNFNLHG